MYISFLEEEEPAPFQASLLNAELDCIQLWKCAWLSIFDGQYIVLKTVLSDQW